MRGCFKPAVRNSKQRTCRRLTSWRWSSRILGLGDTVGNSQGNIASTRRTSGEGADGRVDPSHAGSHTSGRYDVPSSSDLRRGNGYRTSARFSSQEWNCKAKERSSSLPGLPFASKGCQPESEAEVANPMQTEEETCFPWMLARKNAGISVCSQVCKTVLQNESQCHGQIASMHCQNQRYDPVVDKHISSTFRQDVWQAVDRTKVLRDSEQALEDHLTRHRLWDSCGMSPEGTPWTNRKQVTFNDQVDVHIFHGSRRDHFMISTNNAHDILRQRWNSEAGCSSRAHTVAVLSQISHGRVTSSSTDAEQARNNGNQDRSSLGDAESTPQIPSEFTQSVLRRSALGRQTVGSIEVWFLRRGDHEVCTHSRTIQILPADDVGMVFEKCRDVWRDVALNEPFDWHAVRGHPGTSFSTRAHVILTQREAADSTAHLVHWDAWPILMKFRAVLFHRGTTVERAMNQARFDGQALRNGARYGMFYSRNEEAHHLAEYDQIDVPSAQILYGFIQHVVDTDPGDSNASASMQDNVTTTASSGQGETDVESDGVSWFTKLLQEENDEMENDVVSNMTVVSPGLSLQPAMPPGQVAPLEHLPVAIDPEPIIHEEVVQVLDHQWEDIVMSFTQARQDADGSPFRVVTFGLGLIDLGRRDVLINVNDAQSMFDAIADTWNDHAQFADLRVILVQPRPDLAIVGPHICVIVEVMYVAPEHPQRGKPVLIHETGAPSMISDKQTFAAWSEHRATKSAILEIAQRETDVYPNTLRDVHLTVRGMTLRFQQEREIHEGDLCQLDFLELPPHIHEAEQHIVRSSNLLLDMRTADDRQVIDVIRFRIHGISPLNRPLGSRDIYMHIHLFSAENVARQAEQLWPFSSGQAPIIYVRKDDIAPAHEEGHEYVFHLIADFAARHGHHPIMVQQCIYAVNDQTSHSEFWAISIPEGIDRTQIVSSLAHEPFWNIPSARVHVHMPHSHPTFLTGDWCDLVAYTHTKTNLLLMLLEQAESTGSRSQDDASPEHETVSMLQHTAQINQDVHVFQELCSAILYLETEDNSNLRRGQEDCEATDQHNSQQEKAKHHAQTRPIQHQKDECQQGEETTERCTDSDLKCIEELQMLIDELCSPWVGLNVDFETIPFEHPMAQFAMQHSKPSLQHTSTFHVFTDGSYKRGYQTKEGETVEQTAAWAFVVLCESHWRGVTNFHRIGFATDVIQAQLEYQQLDAPTAEAFAIVAMCEYLMSVHIARCPLPFIVISMQKELGLGPLECRTPWNATDSPARFKNMPATWWRWRSNVTKPHIQCTCMLMKGRRTTKWPTHLRHWPGKGGLQVSSQYWSPENCKSMSWLSTHGCKVAKTMNYHRWEHYSPISDHGKGKVGQTAPLTCMNAKTIPGSMLNLGK